MNLVIRWKQTLAQTSSRAALPSVMVLALLVSLPATSWAAGSPPLSDRIVDYRIEGRYDAKSHTLDATELLTYTNKTGTRLDRFPFHLYLNAFQPKSSWMTEARLHGQRDARQGLEWDEKNFGSNTVKSLEIVDSSGSATNLTEQIRFISPDDGNPDDRTVFEVLLPRPVEPGEQIRFRIHFVAKFPEVLARTGYKRSYIMAGQWFPKVGVWSHGAWNCHQFHATTEFFADFGTYDVKLTLPAGWNVGASGVQTAAADNGDGTQTVRFRAEDVHDFAWTAAAETKVVEDSIRLSQGEVKIRLLIQPDHMATVPRYLHALKGTMRKFDEWIGLYPYPQITVVDPPQGAMASGGMEYPTLITVGTTWWMPKGLRMPEIVTEHEFGHQYWYGMVATNEFENAWMDEGINEYLEVKVMDALYGEETSFASSRLASAGLRGTERASYASVADRDPIARFAWKFQGKGTYGAMTYSKTALMLLTLESLIGEQTVMRGLHEYFEKYKFQHPTPEQFTESMNKTAGRNLDWYWKQALYGTETLDDRILLARSERKDWYSKEEEKKGETIYRNEVVVHRLGNFDLPVTLEVRFDDGSTERREWDGKDRWHRYVWEKKEKLVSAEVDPDHHLLLDRNPFNNGWRAEADGRAAGKLAGYWTLLTQWLAHLLTWLA